MNNLSIFFYSYLLVGVILSARDFVRNYKCTGQITLADVFAFFFYILIAPPLQTIVWLDKLGGWIANPEKIILFKKKTTK